MATFDARSSFGSRYFSTELSLSRSEMSIDGDASDYSQTDRGSSVASDGSNFSDLSGVSSTTSMGSAGTFAQSKELRNLKLEIEMRDHRIDELEEAYEAQQREAAFKQGELQAQMEAQDGALKKITLAREQLSASLTGQKARVAAMTAQMKQYAAMGQSLVVMAARCETLEKLAIEEAEASRLRRAAWDAEEAAAATVAEEAAARATPMAAFQAMAEFGDSEDDEFDSEFDEEDFALPPTAAATIAATIAAPATASSSPTRIRTAASTTATAAASPIAETEADAETEVATPVPVVTTVATKVCDLPSILDGIMLGAAPWLFLWTATTCTAFVVGEVLTRRMAMGGKK